MADDCTVLTVAKRVPQDLASVVRFECFRHWVFLGNRLHASMREHWEVQEDQEHENGIAVITCWCLNDDESEDLCTRNNTV